MKPRSCQFPLNLVLRSAVVMTALAPLNSVAADFTWKGTTNSDWETGSNWLVLPAPTYGDDNSADRLVIGNGANAGAVYDPGAGFTTTFGSGRGIIIGSTIQGAANLTVSSGTLKITGPGTVGNEPIMANGVSASVLINGGNLDLTGHGNAFRFFGGSNTGLTSNLTISSGSFSSNGFNFLQAGTAGTGTINLDGGSLSVTGFSRTVTTASTILNLNGGTLQIRNASNANFLNALGGLQTIVKTGGAIIDSNSLNLTIAEVLEHDTTLGAGLDGGLTKNSAGILTLSGANTFNGATTINGGTLQIGAGGTAGSLSTSSTITNDATLAFNRSNSVTQGADFANLIGGTGAVQKNGTGALFLTAGNTYSGATTINTGALIATGNNALGSTAAGTTVVSGSTLAFSGGIDYTSTETITGSGVGSAAISGVLAGTTRGFIQSASGNNTFRGNIVIDAGGVSRIGTQDSASLTLTGTITQASGSILFRAGNSAGDFVTLANAGNSFGGNSTIFTGAAAGNWAGVRLGVSNALPTSLTILGQDATAGGTALDLNGYNQSLNGLAGANNLNIINSNTSTASTLTVDNLVDRISSGTLIRGGGGLGTINVIKDGSFSQTLSGTHDYTGTTAVNNGKLVINGNISTSTLTTVASGATLGGNATTGALTIATGGFVTPGNSVGSVIVNGAYTQAGTYTAEIDGLTPGTQHDQIDVTGTVNITGGSLATVFTGSYSLNDMIFILLNDGADAITGTYSGLAQGAVVTSYGGFDWQISYLADSAANTFTGGNDIVLMAIPEPRAALLAGLGLLALLRRRR